MADRVGGVLSLSFLYLGIALCLGLAATLPSLSLMVPVLFLATLLLGMGNGAVFQLVPQRFPHQIGTLTGLVGSFGGLGGFFLPLVLGGLKDRYESYGVGFFVFASVCLIVLGVLRLAQMHWKWNWKVAEENA